MIIGSKSIVFIAPSQKYFNLVFDFSYVVVVEFYELYVKLLLWRLLMYLGSKNLRMLFICRTNFHTMLS